MKTNHCKNNKKTHSATSLTEAIQLERSNTSLGFWQIGSKLAISFYVFFANALLYCMKKCWFSSITDVNEVVIYTVGTLGDNVLMLPAVAAVRAKYPAAKLSIMTNCDGFGAYAARQVWGNSELVNHFIALPNHPIQRRNYTFELNNDDFEGSDRHCDHVVPSEARNLQPNHGDPSSQAPQDDVQCDLFINLSPFGNRGLLGALIKEMIFARRLGAKQAIGFRLSSYNRKGLFNRMQHLFVTNEARRPRAVLKELDIAPLEDVDLLGHDGVAKKHVEQVLLEAGIEISKGPLILLNPGSKLAASRWPAQRFGELAAWLSKTYGAQVVVNGVESENMICEEVVRASGSMAINFAGRLSVQELIELLRICDACISNNTGTMTLAAMVKTPLIVISSTRFSPTFYMPISKKMIWLFTFSETSYSYNDVGMTSEDMLHIEVQDVVAAYQALIEMKEHCNAFDASKNV